MEFPSQIQFQKISSLHKEALNSVYEISQLNNKTIYSELECTKVASQRSELANRALNNMKGIEDVLVEIQLRSKNLTDSEHEHEGVYILVNSDKWNEKLEDLKMNLRESQLKSYKNENEFNHERRLAQFRNVFSKPEQTKEDLFTHRSTEAESESKTLGDKILSKNETITSSLQTTRGLLESSVMQSELNFDDLMQQSKDLEILDNKYSAFNSILIGSKNLVKMIDRQDKGDRRRLRWSIGFFLLCCSWILYRRILKLPIKIFLWTIFKFLKITMLVIGVFRSGDKNAAVQDMYREILITSAVNEFTATTATEFFDSLDEDIVTTFTDIISQSWQTFTEGAERIVDEL